MSTGPALNREMAKTEPVAIEVKDSVGAPATGTGNRILLIRAQVALVQGCRSIMRWMREGTGWHAVAMASHQRDGPWRNTRPYLLRVARACVRKIPFLALDNITNRTRSSSWIWAEVVE